MAVVPWPQRIMKNVSYRGTRRVGLLFPQYHFACSGKATAQCEEKLLIKTFSETISVPSPVCVDKELEKGVDTACLNSCQVGPNSLLYSTSAVFRL